MAGKPLQFVPFSSALEAGFWHQLAKNKLEVYALDESPKKIHGFYFNGDAAGLPSRVSVDYTAFNSEHRTPSHCFPCVGTLINLNTIDAFKTRDKQALISGVGQQIFEDIGSGKTVDNPDRLSQFVLLTFADLKKYHFYYWFAFPCLTFDQDVTLVADPVTVDKRFSQIQLNSLLKSYDEFQSGQKSGFFVILENGDSLSVQSLSAFETLKSQSNKVLVGFSDPCTLETYPGWPLRNLLWLLAHRWGDNLPEVEVVCFRDRSKDGVRTISHSLVISVKLTSQSKVTECPRVVGWEKNERGKLGPRMVNLSASMDPTRLAESAVDLNLRLMRWRLLPELDLDAVSGTRCLLLGSGTLGCNVARSLLGWGVRSITLVDNGKISYSNPVRQSLFVFEDCLQGGQPKAETAAKALRKIFPGVNSSGLTLSIPMPGHPVGEGALEQTKTDVKTLEELIDSHDAVFLLMDTRESRWLPSLLCAARKKIVINAALGFDTFLVLRHGVKSEREHMEEGGATSWTKPVKGDELGCYFCNDVVAPGNSTKDRTLDQQCTVSRPGMSMIAAALAVEILVSVLQHPDRGLAAADTSSKDDHLSQEFSSCLGLVPHQIRGFLSRFHQVMPASRCFDKCTACSKTVLAAYQQEGFEFLLRAFNQPTYLEDLTGLTQMYAETNDAEVWGLSDEETDTGSMDS